MLYTYIDTMRRKTLCVMRMTLSFLRLFCYDISSSTQFYICICYGVSMHVHVGVYVCLIHESSISQRHVYKDYHMV